MEPKLSSDLLRGHTDTIVLAMLMNGDRYGLEIYNRILDRTGGQYELKVDTLYSSYKRLERAGTSHRIGATKRRARVANTIILQIKGANCIVKTC